MKRWMIMLMAALLSIVLIGCGSSSATPAKEGDHGYKRISQEEAQRLMKSESGCIILDVRTKQEYAEGHISGAICIPNETIGTTPPAELPDKAQMILVYCRSGRRSKEAAQKLANMGYTNILEFGGIIDWRGEITKE